MKKFYSALFFILIIASISAKASDGIVGSDTTEVIRLNLEAYAARLTNPEETINGAKKALDMAIQLNYNSGIAEAYRVMGIGQYYKNQPEVAITNYISSLTYFKKANNRKGEGKVYNNIGNLYRDNNFQRSLEYFQKALEIGKQISDKSLIASSYLNLGNFYFRKDSYNQALVYYHQSQLIFASLGDSVNLIQCSQNTGVSYFYLNQMAMAEKILTDANKSAKAKDLNETVASIDVTLADLYISEGKYDEASKIVAEGLAYSRIIQDEKLERDFNFTNYQLEYKRKDYKQALFYFQQVYNADSARNNSSMFASLNIYEIKHKQEEQQKQAEFIDQQNKYERTRFWMATAVAGLLIIVIGLLVSNVKRKAKTNSQLTELNSEVSRQKDNLDRVNHHLEEIIDERTKDLQIKNRKLSEYSSYLSHQIRGPIATLKGLMNLEKEGLVDKHECIRMMDKCVSEIDEKIIEMSDMMHDPVKKLS